MKVGVLGLGSIGMRHARNLVALGHEVIGYDPDEYKMIVMNGAVVSRDEVFVRSDAIISASPSDRHVNDLRSAVVYGVHAFIEKPIGIRADDLPALVHDAEKIVFCGFNLRFHRCVTQAKKWLDDGLIGAPQWASFTCAQFNDKPAYLRDGVIMNWSHEIDLALHLLGPARVAAAVARTTDGNDDIADIVLKHDSGCQTNIHLDYVTRQEQRGFLIVGDKGDVRADLVHERSAWLDDTAQCELTATDSFDSNYVDEMAAFIDRIEGKEVPGATGEDGLAALDICLQARRMAGLQ